MRRRSRPDVTATLDLFVASLLFSCHQAPSAEPPSPTPSPLVRFVGRFDTSSPDGTRFAWSGSSIVTRFSGRTLHVRLKDPGYNELQVVLDGAPTSVIATSATKEDYEVTAPSDGTHDLILSKRTEARTGEVLFLGFEPRVALSPAAPAPNRRIELIGDSITAGYGDEGTPATCSGNRVALENEYLSYGAIAARSVGADHVTIAWAGKTTEEMATLYERTLPSRPTSRWEFTGWRPDAVVINLGTNDFNRGDPGQVTFMRPYLALVAHVRALYPGALIVCALGPMLTDSYPAGGHTLTRARQYINAVVDKVREAGDQRVTFLEFPSQDFANGLGCDYHPSLKTHRLMGEQLAAALRGQLQW